MRRSDCETEQSNLAKLHQSLLNLVNLWSKFKVGSKTTRFGQIRLFKEVLSGFWVLINVLRFSWFSCIYQFQVLKGQSQKSYANLFEVILQVFGCILHIIFLILSNMYIVYNSLNQQSIGYFQLLKFHYRQIRHASILCHSQI